MCEKACKRFNDTFNDINIKTLQIANFYYSTRIGNEL